MDRRFRLTSSEAASLKAQFGTPLYVLDEAGFRERIGEYRAAVPGARIHYASKANSTLALLKMAHEEGCGIDVASEGELRAAMRAGVPVSGLTLHGNNKPLGLLRMAIELGVAEIVVDALEEVDRLLTLPVGMTELALRVNPGVRVDTHEKISVGHRTSKFGFGPDDLFESVRRLKRAGREVSGLHFHLGSQILDLAPYAAAAKETFALVRAIEAETGWRPSLLNFGGGLGVRYTSEMPPSISDLGATLGEALAEWPYEVKLALEPGRSLVAECGLTLLEVGIVKTIGETMFVSVDGGLYENPRPALYGAAYEVRLVSSDSPDSPDSPTPCPLPIPENGEGVLRTTIVGSHCENDVLYPGIELAQMPKPGDLLQVLTTGAYASAMASNYNRFLRPATVLKRVDGTFALVQRRETYDELFSREII